jgi:signal transduction histidine kinase
MNPIAERLTGWRLSEGRGRSCADVFNILNENIEDVDLASGVAEAIDTVQRDADGKRIAITRELILDKAVGMIAGDAARVQQMIWNLLTNAIKFPPEGGQISVRLAKVGSGAEITVADTGVGIRPEFLPHIFDRFQQADQSITRRFGGLGLGLSIVKHLVDLHGGSVSADSAGIGQGATFTIMLPSSTGATVMAGRNHAILSARCASWSSKTNLIPVNSWTAFSAATVQRS